MKASGAPDRMTARIERLWWRAREPWWRVLLLLPLTVLAQLFGLVVWLRRIWYRGRQHCVAPYVLSVGNLAVGGAGKTPITILLARRLLARGLKVAILSRGYGRSGPEDLDLIVAEPGRLLAAADEAGDEPYLIARSAPGAAVLVGSDRARLADLAVERFQPDAILLDDGFQHLRLARDFDLVVLDASNPFGNGHLMPRGPLREPLSVLRDASCCWLTKIDQAGPGEVERLKHQLSKRTRRSRREPLASRYRPTELIDLSGAPVGEARALKGKRVLLLSGVARPASFRATLLSLGVVIAEEKLFPDHHAFTEEELAEVDRRARELGVEAIVATEKDGVRLRDWKRSPEALALLIVRVEVEVLQPVLLERLIDEIVEEIGREEGGAWR